MITNLFRLPGFTRKPGEKKNNGSNFLQEMKNTKEQITEIEIKVREEREYWKVRDKKKVREA